MRNKMKEKKPESCKYPIAPDGKPIKNWKKGFPDGTDFTGVSFEDKNIYNVDFSKAKGLSWKQLTRD